MAFTQYMLRTGKCNKLITIYVRAGYCHYSKLVVNSVQRKYSNKADSLSRESCVVDIGSSPEQQYQQGRTLPHWVDYSSCSSSTNKEAGAGKGLEACEKLVDESRVINEFISEDEEAELLVQVEPRLRKMRYEYDHWDDAIHGYRECELSLQSDDESISAAVIARISATAGIAGVMIHVIDLAPKGYIKPHIDSVRYCGDVIAGLSLLSSSVMRLRRDTDRDTYVDFLLRPRSLYILRGAGRYDFTHEILSAEESKFRGQAVERGRRVSVICREEAKSEVVQETVVTGGALGDLIAGMDIKDKS